MLSGNCGDDHAADATVHQPGDANQDGQINGHDLVQVLAAGKYGTNQPASWAEGDWNSDHRFDSLDIILLASSGLYNTGPYRNSATEGQTACDPSSNASPLDSLTRQQIRFIRTGGGWNADTPAGASVEATYSLSSLGVSNQIASYQLWMNLSISGSEELVYFSLDVSASDDSLTAGGTDYAAFSFTGASPLLDQWDQILGADFAAGPLRFTVEYDTISSPLAGGNYLLGTLDVDLAAAGVPLGSDLNVSLGGPDSVIGVEQPGQPTTFRFSDARFDDGENVEPAVSAGDDMTTHVGDLVTLNGSFLDPDAGDKHTLHWQISAENGQVLPPGNQSSYIFTPTASGVYAATFTVTDSKGSAGSDTLVITVDNVPPTVDAGPNQTVTEGDLMVLDGSFTDSSVGGRYNVLWHVSSDNGQIVDDGTADDFSFVPEDNGTYIATLRVTDSDGATGTDDAIITVNNAPPKASAGPNKTVSEGQVVHLDGSLTDPGTADTHTFLWQVTAGNGQTFGDGTSEGFSFVPDDDGTYTIRFQVTDDDGASDADTVSVTVEDVPPTANAGPDQTVREGDPVMLEGSFTDPGSADTHTFRWQVSAENGQVIAEGAKEDFSFIPADDGIYDVTFSVADDDGAVGTDTVIIRVENAPPTASAGPDRTVREGGRVTFRGSYTDPGSADTHTLQWRVTDDNGQLIPHGTDGEFSFGPTDSGVYTVIFQVTDDDGGVGTATVTVTVSPVTSEDVTDLVAIDSQIVFFNRRTGQTDMDLLVTNTSTVDIQTPVEIVIISTTDPNVTSATPLPATFVVDDADGILSSGQSIYLARHTFNNPTRVRFELQFTATQLAGSPLHVKGGSATGPYVGDALTEGMLGPVVPEAIAYWSATGVNAGRLGTLQQIEVHVGDLSGTLLGLALPDRILIDRDAAGYGWSHGSQQVGVDLLSAVTHEMGHVLGFDHDHSQDVMRANLASGQHQRGDDAMTSMRPDDLATDSNRTTGETHASVLKTADGNNLVDPCFVTGVDLETHDGADVDVVYDRLYAKFDDLDHAADTLIDDWLRGDAGPEVPVNR